MVRQERPGIFTIAAGLLLGLSCAPALASSGYTDICEKLTLETVDLATSSTIDPSARIETETLEAIDATPVANPLTPKAETILRQIFDEAVADDQETIEPTAVKSPNAAPIAELTAPVIREQRRDIESNKKEPNDADANPVDARVPGLSDEELLRYRRQMYRTDI